MFPKKGKILRSESQLDAHWYAMAIADTLRVELGQSHRATKTLMSWTGASDRTAKNWLQGSCGPSGEHLIRLAGESDAILATILNLAGRHEHLVGAELLAIRRRLADVTQLLDEILDAGHHKARKDFGNGGA
jgi:hypothetical protein